MIGDEGDEDEQEDGDQDDGGNGQRGRVGARLPRKEHCFGRHVFCCGERSKSIFAATEGEFRRAKNREGGNAVLFRAKQNKNKKSQLQLIRFAEYIFQYVKKN